MTDVFVNGKLAGTHKGNFAAFCFDVTPLLRIDQDNVIAVKVNNAWDANIPPLSGDFTVFVGAVLLITVAVDQLRKRRSGQ